MSMELAAANEQTSVVGGNETSTEGLVDADDFVTIYIAGQLFGIPILCVHDVLGPQKITRVPLAPPEVAGVLNLRGRIVTAINVHRRLGLDDKGIGQGMSVVVEYNGESYSLLIDRVGDVLSLPRSQHEATPVTLDQRWREVSNGIYRLEGELLVVLDVERLLAITTEAAAA